MCPQKGEHLSSETRAKISQANKGRHSRFKGMTLEQRFGKEKAEQILAIFRRPKTEEEKRKNSIANKGRKSPLKGKTLEEICGSELAKILIEKRKLASKGRFKGLTYEQRYGYVRAQEIKNKISYNLQGLGKGTPKSEEHKRKLSLAKKGRMLGEDNPSKRPEVRLKISMKKKGCKFSKESIEKSRIGHIAYFKTEKGQRHMEKTRKINGARLKTLWTQEDYRASIMRRVLHGLLKRPTRFEQKIISLIETHKLPFKYVGNGEALIAGKNPDFIATDTRKLIIETYCIYWHNKPQQFPHGYEVDRERIFQTVDYKTLFLNDNDLERKDWEEVCLSKIQNFCLEVSPSIIPLPNPRKN